MTDTNGATVTTVSNYDFLYLDFGIRTGGRSVSGASFMRVEEGVADLRRSYHCGLGF